jgi:hypothetical protein
MLVVAYNPFLPSVVMMNVTMLSVVVPKNKLNRTGLISS